MTLWRLLISSAFLDFLQLGPQWHSEVLIWGFISTLTTPYTLFATGRGGTPHLADLAGWLVVFTGVNSALWPSAFFRVSVGVEEPQEQELCMNGETERQRKCRVACLEMAVEIHGEANVWDVSELSHSDGGEKDKSYVRERWQCKESAETWSGQEGSCEHSCRGVCLCVSCVNWLLEALVLYSDWFYCPKDAWGFSLSFVGLWKNLEWENRVRSGGGLPKVRRCGVVGSVPNPPSYFTLVLEVVSNQPCRETSGLAHTRLATLTQGICTGLLWKVAPFFLLSFLHQDKELCGIPPFPPTYQTNSVHKVEGRGWLIQTVYWMNEWFFFSCQLILFSHFQTSVLSSLLQSSPQGNSSSSLGWTLWYSMYGSQNLGICFSPTSDLNFQVLYVP